MIANKSFRLATCLGLSLGCSGMALTGCDDDDGLFADDVDTDVQYDEDVEFEQFSTFAFEERDDIEEETFDGLSEQQQEDLELVNDQIREELTEIGLREVDPRDADLLVFSLSRTDVDTSVTWECVAGGWGGYWYWGYRTYDPCAWYDAERVVVTDRSVLVGLADPAQEETVFVGVVNSVEDSADERREELEEGIDEVFDEYPAEPEPTPDAGTPDGGVTDAGADADAGEEDASADAGDAGEDG